MKRVSTDQYIHMAFYIVELINPLSFRDTLKILVFEGNSRFACMESGCGNIRLPCKVTRSPHSHIFFSRYIFHDG